jgi:hypothetical protein
MQRAAQAPMPRSAPAFLRTLMNTSWHLVFISVNTRRRERSPARTGLHSLSFSHKHNCAGPNACLQAPGAIAAAAMNINTVVRVRPLPRDYEGGRTLTVMDESSVALCAPPPDAGQRDYKGDALAVQDKVELSEQDK